MEVTPKFIQNITKIRIIFCSAVIKKRSLHSPLLRLAAGIENVFSSGEGRERVRIAALPKKLSKTLKLTAMG